MQSVGLLRGVREVKIFQPSFASGEISPLLHARVDLARYSTGLAELRNMIVLPQGGVTRRPGFMPGNVNGFGSFYGAEAKLIPFVYNSSDSVMLEFGNYTARVWVMSGGTAKAIANFVTPYSIADVQALRYVQSGNVLFMAHKSYRPKMLTRKSLTQWTFSDLDFHDGPFIDGSEWAAGVELQLHKLSRTNGTYRITVTTKNNAELFNSSLVGTLLKVEYTVEGKTGTVQSEGTAIKYSENYEVKGTMNVVTSGDNWLGTVFIQRSIDGGDTWVTIRQYIRNDTKTQGQWDFTVSETEDYVLYRVGLIDETSTPKKENEEGQEGEESGGSENDNEPVSGVGQIIHISNGSTNSETTKQDGTILVTISVSGFLRRETYKIMSVANSYTATLTLPDELAAITNRITGFVSVKLWSMGSWGIQQGFPAAVAMYQDRLIFASTPLQPQTIWMSKTGDYANFGVSDPLSDDDAINITLAGSSADCIHSLVTTQDLFAFTEAGEWRIRGAGDSGAISPTALTAHQQTNIGSKALQPMIANGQIIFVQTQGQKVYTLGYDLNIDGYTGHEISIMSAHLFEGKEIISAAYQQIPDSLLWFVLSDGSAAVCTYNPEHEIIGWSRQEISKHYGMRSIAALPGANQTELFLITLSVNIWLMTLNERLNENNFMDNTSYYESSMRTLRANSEGENGSTYANKKLIPRLIIHSLKTSEAWAAPGDYSDEAKNWERRRRVRFENTGYLSDSDLQLDNGFARDACIQIRSEQGQALTILAISPVITQGG